MTRPTRDEMIERIDRECIVGNDMPIVAISATLLTDLRSHLSDPWIPVEERLPEYGRRMAIDFDDAVPNRFYTGWLCDDDVWYCEQVGEVVVTRYCPLPPLPKKGE